MLIVIIVIIVISSIVFVIIIIAKKFNENQANLIARESEQVTEECNEQDEFLELRPLDCFIDPEHLIIGVKLGKGYFGEVKRAEYNRDGEVINVAVKFITNQTQNEQEAIIEEIKIMHNFRHQHVLGMFGWSLHIDNSPMIVMPIMEKGDLHSFIRDGQNYLTVKDLLEFAIDVAKGKLIMVINMVDIYFQYDIYRDELFGSNELRSS